jgi:glycosyltransferase involved in cell wall biosynthesis
VIVLPARLLWDKGVGEFVEAARLLRSRGVEARFVLVGDPDPANPASISAAQIADWVQDGVVEHMGWMNDMPGVFAHAHIVCLPSYREGLPKALIEAAAAGRPIVTTDVPGCREVVEDGVHGLCVAPRDANALASALARLIADPALRARMGAAARKRAETEFGLAAVIAQTLALYREVSP